MSIGIHEIKIIENCISGMGINLIKRKEQVIFQQNHFCTQNLRTIKETVEKLIELEFTSDSYYKE